MKIKNYLLAVLALSFSATQLNAQEPAQKDVAIAEGVTVAPTIDGDLSDWDFSTNTQQGIKMQTVNPDWAHIPQENMLFWKATWDENNLYLAVAVVDGVLASYQQYTDKSGSPWMGDRVDFSVGADITQKGGWGATANVGSQIMYKAEGEAPQVGGEIGVNHVIKADANILGLGAAGYVMEASVPWSEYGVTPADAVEILFNVKIWDFDNGWGGDGNNTYFLNELGWATYDNTWGTMANAGKLTLEASTLSNDVAKMAELEFSLSPNPSTSNLNVKIASDINNIKVFSVTGQMLNNIDIDNKKEVSVDVASFKKGMYLLQVNTSEGMFTKRFIKK